jgi:hypothetical protein
VAGRERQAENRRLWREATPEQRANWSTWVKTQRRTQSTWLPREKWWLAEPLPRVWWIHYQTRADHWSHRNGRPQQGRALEGSDLAQAVWAMPDKDVDRLFVKIWRDPEQPDLSYSLEDWQTPRLPGSPIDAPPYYGDSFLYAIAQRRPEIEDVAGKIREILQAEPLFGAADVEQQLVRLQARFEELDALDRRDLERSEAGEAAREFGDI